MLSGCRKFFFIVSLVAGCFHAGNVLAVGLGNLEINSTLSEPLDATIQLLGLDALLLLCVRVFLQLMFKKLFGWFGG